MRHKPLRIQWPSKIRVRYAAVQTTYPNARFGVETGSKNGMAPAAAVGPGSKGASFGKIPKYFAGSGVFSCVGGVIFQYPGALESVPL